MAGISDNAICLRRWDYSETSQTVALLCREHGVIRGLAKGAKRPRSKFSGGFDILTRGQIVFSTRARTGLATLMEWHLDCVYQSPRQSMPANRAAVFMLDLVQHGLDEADPHPPVFEALTIALDALEAADVQAQRTDEAEAALLWFQLRFLEDIGYRPQLDTDALSGRTLEDSPTYAFSPGAGGIVADNGRPDRWRVRAQTIALLREARLARVPGQWDQQVAHRANRLLATWVREVIGRALPSFSWVFPEHGLGRPAQITRP